MSENFCQIHSVGQMSEPLGIAEKFWQRRNRLRRILKRRWRYLGNSFSKIFGSKRKVLSHKVKDASVHSLQPGDLVRVRSKDEIQATLNSWNQLKGCSFMEEMLPYCNTRQRVFKRIEKFLDERDYLMKTTRGIVILEGVFCQGTKDFGVCDRTCFYFWREEWLEKMDKNSPKTPVDVG
jgi:hypothetical protein